MLKRLLLLCVVAILISTAPPLFAQSTISVNNGERIVLLGDAFIERLQANGYFEATLLSRLPERDLVIRNLGWSGDTVQGVARAVFGSPEDGYQRLLKDTRDVKPTLIVLNYGGNEAHAGEVGLEAFTKQLHRLLDDLKSTGARIALLSPTPSARVSKLQPDPTPYNRNLAAYSDVLRKTAADRKLPFVDLSEGFDPAWKENGIHFSRYGYWRMANRMAGAFQAPPEPWEIRVDVGKEAYSADNVAVSDIDFRSEDGGLRFAALDRQLPPPTPPNFSPKSAKANAGRVTITGLKKGRYRLLAGDDVLATANRKQWAEGVALSRRAGSRQTAALRKAIAAKNELYFHRYRPQNETYLFLFRKHEQGNNAVEIPQYDPLIKELEARIEGLRKPRPHQYRLEPVKKP